MPLVTAPFVFFPPAGLFVAGVGLAVQPVLPKQYVWRKGDFEIEAYVRTGVFCRYATTLGSWRWRPIRGKGLKK